MPAEQINAAGKQLLKRCVDLPANLVPAAVHPKELLRPRAYLDRLRVHQVDLLALRFLGAGGGAYFLDFVLATVMTRSYSLIEGFLDAFDRWNPVVAAPLLRMQLDSLVRVHYIATVKGSRPFAERLIAGEEFRNITDAEGKRLTDHRLNELAKDDHPWIESVCKATSGWVHFSPEHLRAAFQVQEQDDGTFTIAGGIPIRPEQIPVSALEELIGAMIQATEELGTYMESWEARKDRK